MRFRRLIIIILADEVAADKHIPVLIPLDAGNRTGARSGWIGGRYAWMRYVLTSDAIRIEVEPPARHAPTRTTTL